jgi:hypothetical protein
MILHIYIYSVEFVNVAFSCGSFYSCGIHCMLRSLVCISIQSGSDPCICDMSCVVGARKILPEDVP